MDLLMYILTVLMDIVVWVFVAIGIVVAVVLVLAIIAIALACEIVMLPITIIAFLLYYLAGIGSLDWWTTISLWFVEAGESVVSFIQSIGAFLGF